MGNENFQVSDGRVQEVLGFVVDAIYTSLVLKGQFLDWEWAVM